MSNTPKRKPQMKPVGEDGNIFSIMAGATRLLTNAGMKPEADEMVSRVYASDDYDTALRIISEYVKTELT